MHVNRVRGFGVRGNLFMSFLSLGGQGWHVTPFCAGAISPCVNLVSASKTVLISALIHVACIFMGESLS
jgi:hypothetical protein